MRDTAKVIRFEQWNCLIEKAKYHTGNTALRLIDADDLTGYDNLVAVASVNLPGIIGEEVAIKDWSENTGMYMTLLDANVITPAHRYLSSGFIESIPVCYLVDDDNMAGE